MRQVGAADRALADDSGSGDHQDSRRSQGTRVQCASLKSNMGHLEAAAAAAGLSSLVLTPLRSGVVVVNAQLRGSVVRSFSSRLPLTWRVCAPVG